MQTSIVQTIKFAIVTSSGLEKDALHIYVGLAVFFATALIFKKPLKSMWPYLAVLAIAVAGEFFDLRDDLANWGRWRWKASLHDIANTQFWPAVIMMLAKYSRLFRGSGDSSA